MLTRAPGTLALAGRGLRAFTARHVLVAVVVSIAVALLIGTVTVLIPNSVFGRDIPPVAWNYPIWILTSILTGLLVATYVRVPGTGAMPDEAAAPADGASIQADTEQAPGDRSSALGMIGTVLAWFAVGCPVCNKIALLALGYSGAITWFALMQPVLAALAVALCTLALVQRLKGMVVCEVPAR